MGRCQHGQSPCNGQLPTADIDHAVPLALQCATCETASKGRTVVRPADATAHSIVGTVIGDGSKTPTS